MACKRSAVRSRLPPPITRVAPSSLEFHEIWAKSRPTCCSKSLIETKARLPKMQAHGFPSAALNSADRKWPVTDRRSFCAEGCAQALFDSHRALRCRLLGKRGEGTLYAVASERSQSTGDIAQRRARVELRSNWSRLVFASCSGESHQIRFLPVRQTPHRASNRR